MDSFAEDANYDRYDPTIEDDIARIFKVLIELQKPIILGGEFTNTNFLVQENLRGSCYHT